MRLDLSVSETTVDIVARGYDAGARLGEVIDRDMIAVPARVLTTDPATNIRLARAGAGVPMVREDRVRDAIAAGELVPVLEAFCTPFPGYHLYYPQRRHASPALRALVDYLRETHRRSSRRKAAPSRGAAPVRAARGGRDGGRR